MKYILASASPRRKELLQQMGINEFEIHPAKGEEVITKTVPSDIVMELAEKKALEVKEEMIQDAADDIVILSADTIVVYEDEILGKPKDEADAYRMLSMLSGNTHQVYTGVCILYPKKNIAETFYEKTDVTMCKMSEQELNSYIASKDPMDKAGGYGIQGKCAVYIEKICGDYNNVVGLPISSLYHKLRNLEIAI